MRTLAILLVLIGAEPALAEPVQWRPSEPLLNAVRFVESSNGKMIFGDAGRSLGDYQMSAAAWADVSAWRQARKLTVYEYPRDVFDVSISRQYAADYLCILHLTLNRHLRRVPTVAELYAAYNVGITRMTGAGFRLSRVNPVTLRKCRLVTAMVEGR